MPSKNWYIISKNIVAIFNKDVKWWTKTHGDGEIMIVNAPLIKIKEVDSVKSSFY